MNVIYDTLFSLEKRKVIHTHIIALQDKRLRKRSEKIFYQTYILYIQQ